MKNILRLSLISLVFALGLNAFAQTILSTTTLTASAFKGARGSQITVNSTSGIVAGTDLFIDRELIQVANVPSSGTTIGVIRGYGGTVGATHANSSLVFIIPAAAQPYALVTTSPQGSCARGAASLSGGLATSTSTLYLPIINQRHGTFIDCVGGEFVEGVNNPLQVTPFQIQAPPTGGTIYTSLNTNGTTLAATTMYCTEIDLPFNKLLTGIGILNGTTVGTDNHLVALYDSTGNLIANSAAAGVLAATGSEYQSIAFTSKYYAVGPAQYFGCLQTNGTTATVRMLITQVMDTYLTKGVTSITFGTVPATITVPTTFTTAVGPYEIVY